MPFSVSCGKADVTFIVDSSGSINFLNKNNWARIVAFINKFVSDETFSDDTRFAVVCYSDNATTVFDLNDYTTRGAVSSAVSRDLVYKKGQTNIAAGLRAAQQVFTVGGGDRPDADNIAILISDGNATLETRNTQDEARTLRAQLVYVVSIGITGNINANELSQISSNRQVLKVEDFSQLNAELGTVLNAACRTTTPAPDIIITSPITTTTLTTTTTTTTTTATPGQYWTLYVMFMHLSDILSMNK